MQYVFVMGGWNGVSCNSDIAVYSPDGAPSAHMAPNARNMLSPRDALASAVVDHDVLALGGHDGSNYLASCEIYTASTPGKGRFTGAFGVCVCVSLCPFSHVCIHMRIYIWVYMHT